MLVEVAQVLKRWYRKQGRNLPWRRTQDPYRILVSEFMLQQTQVDRVKPKYESWLAAFPDWQALASAKRSEVLRLWSGLGYNSRAVRLHVLAKIVVDAFDGVLPCDEQELVKLPGIGPYTAGAIMCFAYDEPGACIDVNVERVVKRLCFSKRARPDRRRVGKAVGDLLACDPRIVANALMDLGSAYCTATGPDCDGCPLSANCKSQGERPEERERREKKRQKPFVGSNRWWRGQILKRLAVRPMAVGILLREIRDDGDERAFRNALGQLKEEGFITGEKCLRIKD